MIKKSILILITIALILFSGCNFNQEVKNENTQIANPASVYCEEQGGKLEIRENTQGQYGVCIFEDFECEEWAFYRKECPDKKSNLGEFCGGIEVIECTEGLKCQYDGDYHNAGGLCVSIDKIISFDECVAAGNPTTKSYPAECIANNKTFYDTMPRDPIEDKCTKEYEPVCGENGRSYLNKCMAGNISIAYEGECK